MEQQNSDSRGEILQSIRKHKERFQDTASDCVVLSPASGLSQDELTDKFKQSLEAAGASIIEVGKNAVEASIISLGNNVLDFNKPEVRAEYTASCTLEKLEQIEHLVLQGNFGVAENGAIWLEDNDLPNRLLPFITRRLMLQLNICEIVPTMQEAYSRINLKETGFGVFISGPSKTADIEQSLVYGAHGAKELTVLLVSDNFADEEVVSNERR